MGNQFNQKFLRFCFWSERRKKLNERSRSAGKELYLPTVVFTLSSSVKTVGPGFSVQVLSQQADDFLSQSGQHSGTLGCKRFRSSRLCKRRLDMSGYYIKIIKILLASFQPLSSQPGREIVGGPEEEMHKSLIPQSIKISKTHDFDFCGLFLVTVHRDEPSWVLDWTSISILSSSSFDPWLTVIVHMTTYVLEQFPPRLHCPRSEVSSQCGGRRRNDR